MAHIERNEIIGVSAGILVVLVLFAGMRLFPGVVGGLGSTVAQNGSNNDSDIVHLTDDSDAFSLLTGALTSSGEVTKLIIEDTEVGEGAVVVEGSRVTVHYEGMLQSGVIFDSSIERDRPYTFTVGRGDVIEGWDIGLLGMREGGERVLVVPASMAYGSRSVGPIPPNSTLLFSVTVLEVK